MSDKKIFLINDTNIFQQHLGFGFQGNRAVEIVNRFYRHPDAPNDALFTQVEIDNFRGFVFDPNDPRYPAYQLLEYAAKNFGVVYRSLKSPVDRPERFDLNG